MMNDDDTTIFSHRDSHGELLKLASSIYESVDDGTEDDKLITVLVHSLGGLLMSSIYALPIAEAAGLFAQWPGFDDGREPSLGAIVDLLEYAGATLGPEPE